MYMQGVARLTATRVREGAKHVLNYLPPFQLLLDLYGTCIYKRNLALSTLNRTYL